MQLRYNSNLGKMCERAFFACRSIVRTMIFGKRNPVHLFILLILILTIISENLQIITPAIRRIFKSKKKSTSFFPE